MRQIRQFSYILLLAALASCHKSTNAPSPITEITASGMLQEAGVVTFPNGVFSMTSISSNQFLLSSTAGNYLLFSNDIDMQPYLSSPVSIKAFDTHLRSNSGLELYRVTHIGNLSGTKITH